MNLEDFIVNEEMTLEEVIKKEEEIIKEIYSLKEKLIEVEFLEKLQECKLWVETPFAQKGLKNAEQRKAYVKNELANGIKKSDMYKNQINFCENALKMARFRSKILFEDVKEVGTPKEL